MANNWAIVIGINEYEHHPEQNLRYATQDAQAIKNFNDGLPVTSYFDVNAVKFAQCDNLECNGEGTFIQELSSGEFGYGRDTSIAWLEEQRLMYISFLDSFKSYLGD